MEEVRIQISGAQGRTARYEAAVRRAGGQPVVGFCPRPDLTCGGLLLCGGGDLAPAWYGAADRGSGPPDLDRDRSELALVRAYLSAGRPILGICRGLQVLNVALGGTLIQDLGDALRPFHQGERDLWHPICTAPGSLLHRLWGSRILINSAHHQAADRLGDGLRRTAWSEGGVTEAVEHSCLPVAAVQFHPERLDRYQAELARSPETSPEEAVVRVNIGLDAPPYGVGEPVDEPASLTALVNKYHPLPADYVPELELLPPGYTASQGARLRPEACAAFLQMADAAAEEGLRLYSASPYRSYAAQERVYQRYAAQQGAEAADTYSARAGFSEHQTGLALDINVASLSARFEETAEYAWLSAHSWEYGFILRFPQGKEDLTGYLFEPWHYRYVGPETARLCHEQGWTLEEFWARQPVCGTGPVLTLEGEPLSFSRLPLVLDGDVYVPAEELARAIGWASAEQPDGTLLLWGERRQARLFEGRSLLSGGSSVSLDCPVIRANGVLMAPVKALCQALDLPCEQGEAGLDLRTSADTWDWVQKLDQSCRQHGITLEQAVGGLAVDRLERWIRPAERWLSPQLDLFFWAAGRK